MTWNTIGVANGAHALSAVARDAAGNTTTSASLATTVSNPAGGGIAQDAMAFGDTATAATTVVTNAFSTSSSNELLLAFVSGGWVSGTTSVTGVTGGGLSWTLVRRTNTQRGTAEIWRAFAPAQLSGVSVTATLSPSTTASITVVTFGAGD